MLLSEHLMRGYLHAEVATLKCRRFVHPECQVATADSMSMFECKTEVFRKHKSDSQVAGNATQNATSLQQRAVQLPRQAASTAKGIRVTSCNTSQYVTTKVVFLLQVRLGCICNRLCNNIYMVSKNDLQVCFRVALGWQSVQ